MFQNLGDLRQPGGKKPDNQAGCRNKDDGGQADEPVGFGGDVKDGGELVHQGDDPDGQPGEPPAPLVVVGQEFPIPEQVDEQGQQAQIKYYQDGSLH